MMTNKRLFDLVVKFTVSSILSDSFFLSDRESFEICSSALLRLEGPYLPWPSTSFCVARALSTTVFTRGMRRSKGFGWQRNSAPQTLSTLSREDCIHFGGKKIQLRKLFQPSAEKIGYILVASIANKEEICRDKAPYDAYRVNA
jgi:hypothetical protein